MRKIIEDQLKRCVWADLSHFDKETNTYYIPKYTKAQYCLNTCYLIKLPIDIVNNAASVLATNYNNGSFPKKQYYKAYVSKALGTLIYVDCLAYDFDNRIDLQEMWSGWLDTSTLTQIAKL